MPRQTRRMEFYPPQPDREPPAPAVISNTFMVYTREDGVTQFLQSSGIGCNDDEARSYPSHDFPNLEAAKEYIKALSKNIDLKSVTWSME